jgi:hypothetical protein
MPAIRLIAILLLPVLIAWTIPTYAEDASSAAISDSSDKSHTTSDISDIETQLRIMDRQILLELLNLAEFNVQYQQNINHCARWRKILYPIGQEAGYAGFLGFSASDISQRGRAWNNLKLVSPTTIKRGLSSATVGSLLGASSSMIELLADGAETLSANRKGYSIKESVAFVRSKVERVDEMLARRHELMTALESTATNNELLDLKEQLLKYERDRLVYEFKRWSAHSRGYAWYKNAFYVNNVAVNMARFTAVQLGFKSFTAPSCNGRIGPILISAACVAGIAPAASSAVGSLMQHHHMKSMSRSLPVTPFLSDQEAKKKFERLAELLSNDEAQGHRNLIAAELVRLREEKIGLDTLIYHEEKNINRLRRVAGQQSIAAPILSTAGMASGILSTVGYYGYKRHPLITNKLSLCGDSALIPAEGIALFLTPAAAIVAGLYEHDLKKKNEHPDQLFAKRLKDLRTLETILTEISH